MNHMKSVRFPDAFVTRLLPSTTCESLDEPVQCVLFDLDDTLYPVRPPLEAAHGTQQQRRGECILCRLWVVVVVMRGADGGDGSSSGEVV